MRKDFVIACASSQTIPEAFFHDLSQIITQFPMDLTKSENKKLGTNFYVSVDTHEVLLLSNRLMELSSKFQIDVGLIPENLFHTPKSLVIFDMDSTLITAEVIDEMAAKFGVGDAVKLITKRAMNGELNFDQSLKERVALLKGFNRSHMDEILKDLTFTAGVPEFLQRLNQLGIKTAIASGGFEYFARNIQSQLRMDYVYANNLEFVDDRLNGAILGPIVNAKTKEEIVIDLSEKNKLTLDQVVAIGDGANDIPMLLKAGLGIAIHAKEKVQKEARFRINYGPMTHALSYMNLDETL